MNRVFLSYNVETERKAAYFVAGDFFGLQELGEMRFVSRALMNLMKYHTEAGSCWRSEKVKEQKGSHYSVIPPSCPPYAL